MIDKSMHKTIVHKTILLSALGIGWVVTWWRNDVLGDETA